MRHKQFSDWLDHEDLADDPGAELAMGLIRCPELFEAALELIAWFDADIGGGVALDIVTVRPPKSAYGDNDGAFTYAAESLSSFFFKLGILISDDLREDEEPEAEITELSEHDD